MPVFINSHESILTENRLFNLKKYSSKDYSLIRIENKYQENSFYYGNKAKYLFWGECFWTLNSVLQLIDAIYLSFNTYIPSGFDLYNIHISDTGIDIKFWKVKRYEVTFLKSEKQLALNFFL
jgi:hypothetical protein